MKRDGKEITKRDINKFADAQWTKHEVALQKKKANKTLNKAKSLEQERLDSGDWHYVTMDGVGGRPVRVLRRKKPLNTL